MKNSGGSYKYDMAQPSPPKHVTEPLSSKPGTKPSPPELQLGTSLPGLSSGLYPGLLSWRFSPHWSWQQLDRLLRTSTHQGHRAEPPPPGHRTEPPPPGDGMEPSPPGHGTEVRLEFGCCLPDVEFSFI